MEVYFTGNEPQGVYIYSMNITHSHKETTVTYDSLIAKISGTYTAGQVKAVQAVNTSLTQSYWEIGQHIVEFEQGGDAKAEYGKALLINLSKDLSLLHGKGFSLSNLKRMRQFYLQYPIGATASHLLAKGATASHKLSWSHYVEFLKIDDPLERSFYEKQTVLENWSIPELKRQMKTSLFLRLAATKDKEGIFSSGEDANSPGVGIFNIMIACF